MFKINEIFYSIQGEGYFSGTPSIFIRFSGCNLNCTFCDTKHEEGTQMSSAEIIAEVQKYPAKHVVLTGGEPSLFVTTDFVEELHVVGKFVAVETNGTHQLPTNIDWITFSPKDLWSNDDRYLSCIDRCNEIKIVYTGQPLVKYINFKADHFYLQPCDTQNEEENAKLLAAVVEYCKANPQWSISVQLHKILRVR